MFDWIPIEYYTPIYFNIIGIFILFTFLYSQFFQFEDKRNRIFIITSGILLFWFTLLYLGLRPIHGVFTDMKTYANVYRKYQTDQIQIINKDIVFQSFMYYSSRIFTADQFFFLCASIYVLPMYIISKKWFDKAWYYSFLLLVGSFSFWAYGTNGIRNGLASSIFILALAQEKLVFKLIIIYISTLFHGSMILPALAFVTTLFVNNPKYYFIFWLITIPLSIALPGFWENFFSSFIDDDRASYLTDNKYADSFSRTGFRWDFLLYSASGVFAGWYYLYKKQIKDNLYNNLLSIYLFTNGFWILVIRASFSNRFAYLSWFMLALVIIYPWIKIYFINKQYKKLGIITVMYFAFTYLMTVILK